MQSCESGATPPIISSIINIVVMVKWIMNELLTNIANRRKVLFQVLNKHTQSVHFEAADDYQVLFEDPSYADGYSPPLQVAQRYIITVPENKKKGGK